MSDEGTDLHWIRAAANELNNLLQVIMESSALLETLVQDNPEAKKYLAILRSSAERATGATRTLTAGAGGDASGALRAPPVTAPPSDSRLGAPSPFLSPPIEIHNPTSRGDLILIVDDEEFITLLARAVLSDDGYRVVTARNGFQALEIYRKLRDEISLVILDFTMPVMDGADVFAELQCINPKVAVVLSSGFTELDKLRAMLARGLRGFIPKPYAQEKLLHQVRQTLDAIHAEKG